MNKMLIAVGLIFVICMIIGYARGFLKIVASLGATLAIIAFVIFISPFVSNMILEMVPLENTIQEKCVQMLGLESDEGQVVVPEELERSRETQIQLIENAKMPELFQQLLLENNNDDIYQALGVTTFIEDVGSYLAKLIADIVSFLIVLIVVTVVIRTILYTLGIIEKLPVIGGLNRLAGGVLGLGTGLVIVWVLFVAITLFYDTEIGRQCYESIMQDEFLQNLYHSNILMNYITKFRV